MGNDDDDDFGGFSNHQDDNKGLPDNDESIVVEQKTETQSSITENIESTALDVDDDDPFAGLDLGPPPPPTNLWNANNNDNNEEIGEEEVVVIVDFNKVDYPPNNAHEMNYSNTLMDEATIISLPLSIN